MPIHKTNTFKFTILVSLLWFLMGCDQNGNTHMHILSAKAGDSIRYVHRNDSMMMAMAGEFQSNHKDTLSSIVVVRDGREHRFTQIPADFLNQNCTVEFSTNEFKDYFPKEWALLKDAENFATLRIYVESGFFHLIVINSLNGSEIARHAEKF